MKLPTSLTSTSFVINLLWLAIMTTTFSSCEDNELIPPQGIQLRIQNDTVFFAVIGDYGDAGPIALEVSEMVDSWNPDFIVTTGDNNYNDGDEKTLNANIGQYYCKYIYNPDAPKEHLCLGTAYRNKLNRFFPCPGNHDYNDEDGLTPYLNFFTLPGDEVYYDFNWGPVHVFSLNSGKYGDEKCCKTNQTKWLKEKLSGSSAPWKIAFLHHAPYSSAHHGSHEKVQWPFAKWGVNAVLSGHDHVYQRIIPKEKNAIPYFVNGLGGKSNKYECNEHPLSSADFESICYNEQHGAMQVWATSSEIHFSFYSLDDWENPVDSYQIYK